MSIALKDAGGNTVNLPTSTFDANGALTVSLASVPLPTNAAKSTDIAAVIQALAPLATDADLQAVTAKMEAVRALLAAILTIQGTVTANLGTLNGAALDATVSALGGKLDTLHADTGTTLHADLGALLAQLKTTLAFGLPTGAATAAKQPALGTAGTPSADVLTIQGGTGGLPVIVSGGAAAGVAPNNPPLSASGIDDGGLKRHLLTDASGALRQAASGAGGHTAVPAGSTNGTAIGTRPATYVRGVLLELQAGDSVTFSIQATQPTAAPLTRTLAVPSGGLLSQYFADLAPGVMLYVTATSGSPLFRWI